MSTPEDELERLMPLCAVPDDVRAAVMTPGVRARLVAAGCRVEAGVFGDEVVWLPGADRPRGALAALRALDSLGDEGPAAVAAVASLAGPREARKYLRELLAERRRGRRG